MTNWISIDQQTFASLLATLGKLNHVSDYNHSEKTWTYSVNEVKYLQKVKYYNHYGYYHNTHVYKEV